MSKELKNGLILILKFLIASATIVGLVFSYICIFPTDMTWIVTGGKIAVGILLACGVAFIAVWYFSCKGMTAVVTETWYRSLFHVAGMMVIIAISLQRENEEGWSFLVYGIFVVFFLIVLLLSWIDKQIEELSWLWNTTKGLGGGAFGDFANAIGILAGIGAYQLKDASPGWFWLGQIGAFLAMIIGLSLCLRWIRDDPRKDESGNEESNPWKEEDNKAPNPLFTHWFYGSSAFVAGAATFLAILSDTASEDPMPSLRHDGWLFGLQLLFLVVMFLTIFYMAIKYSQKIRGHANLKKAEDGKPKFPCLVAKFDLLLLRIFLWNSGVLIYLILNFTTDDIHPDWISTFFGSWAILSGVFIEFGALWTAGGTYWDESAFRTVVEVVDASRREIKAIKNMLDPLKMMRGLDIILGNLALLVLVLWIACWEPDADRYTSPVQWFLFSGAIVLMTQAALGGILISTHDVAKRKAPTATQGPPGGNAPGTVQTVVIPTSPPVSQVTQPPMAGAIQVMPMSSPKPPVAPHTQTAPAPASRTQTGVNPVRQTRPPLKRR